MSFLAGDSAAAAHDRLAAARQIQRGASRPAPAAGCAALDVRVGLAGEPCDGSVTLLTVGRALWAHRRKIYGLAAAAGIALVSVALVFFTVIVGGTPDH